jgi:hypothetical protein
MNMREIEIRLAKWLYQTMTDYRWHSRVGLSWEQYQLQVKTEKERFRARMYEIVALGLYGGKK